MGKCRFLVGASWPYKRRLLRGENTETQRRDCREMMGWEGSGGSMAGVLWNASSGCALTTSREKAWCIMYSFSSKASNRRATSVLPNRSQIT
jgi:hypothetical protein